MFVLDLSMKKDSLFGPSTWFHLVATSSNGTNGTATSHGFLGKWVLLLIVAYPNSGAASHMYFDHPSNTPSKKKTLLMCLFMCFFWVGWKDSKKISPKKTLTMYHNDVW